MIAGHSTPISSFLPLVLLWCFTAGGCTDPVVTVACSSSLSAQTIGCPIPRATEGCKTTVAVHVSGGITPEIEWTPACGMNHVVVRIARGDGGGGVVLWSLSARLGFLGPGLVYGDEPAGTLLESPTRALQPGATYRVFLEMIDDGTTITGQGTGTFTP